MGLRPWAPGLHGHAPSHFPTNQIPDANCPLAFGRHESLSVGEKCQAGNGGNRCLEGAPFPGSRDIPNADRLASERRKGSAIVRQAETAIALELLHLLARGGVPLANVDRAPFDIRA